MNEVINLKKNKFVLKILALAILVGLILFGGTVLYIHLNTFDIDYTEETLEEYIDLHEYEDIFSIEGLSLNVKVPENILNTEIKKVIIESNDNEDVLIDDVSINVDANTLDINTSLNGINIPIKITYDYSNKGNNIILETQKIGLANMNFEPPFLLKYNLTKNYSFLTDEIMVNTEKYFNTELFNLESIESKESVIKVSLSIDENKITEEIYYIKGSMNSELAHYYETYGDKYEKASLMYIKNTDGLLESDYESLLVDALGDGDIIEALVLLGSSDVISNLVTKYGDYLVTLDEKELLLNKEDRLYSIIQDYSKSIFKAFNIYFHNDEMYINKGQPYSFNKEQIITIKDIVEFYDIEMKEATYKKLSFIYDFDNETLYIAYNIDDEKVILTDDKSDQKTISLKEYEELSKYEDTGEINSEVFLYDYEAMVKGIKEDLNTDTIFNRYIRYDEKNIFIVVSPDYDYQEPIAYALESSDTSYEMIERDVKNILEFNKAYSNFNLEVVTKEVEDVKTIALNDNMHQVILDDLIYRNIIEKTDNLDIIYCSYAGNYISIKLSDDSEYVYNIFNMRLYDVKEKYEAIVYWDDIPDIILLDDLIINQNMEVTDEIKVEE